MSRRDEIGPVFQRRCSEAKILLYRFVFIVLAAQAACHLIEQFDGGYVWDNAAMESFFSSLKTERTVRKVYRTRDDAKADVFDYIERFYNPRRRHSTLGYSSPIEFEERTMLA